MASTSPMTKPPTTEILSMAKLSKGRPGSKDGTGWIEAEAQKITEGEGGEWIALAKQGKRAMCPRCGQRKLHVGGAGDRKVKLTCWSDECHPVAASRREIATLLTDMPGKGYDPSGLKILAPFSVRRKARRIKPLPKPIEALIPLGKPERKVVLWLATLAKGRSWFQVTQRGICAGCGVSGRDAVPILRRLVVHKLIEVQKNGYAAKRATKVRFLVDSEWLAMCLAASEQNGVTKHQNGVTKERATPIRMVRLTETAAIKKRHWNDTPVEPASANEPSATKRDASPRSLDETLAAAADPMRQPVRGAKRPMTSAAASKDEAANLDPTPVVEPSAFHSDHPPPPPPDPALATHAVEECGYACRKGCVQPDGVCVKLKQSWKVEQSASWRDKASDVQTDSERNGKWAR